MDWKRRLLIAAVVSLTATAGLAILILLFGDFGETEGRILGTTAAISFCSLLALPGGVLRERRVAEGVGWVSIALAAAAFVLVLALLWGPEDSVGLGKVAGTVAAFAVASTQIAALTTRRRDEDSASVSATYAAAVALALLLATLVAVAIWAEVDSSAFFRALAALAVLDVLLIALQPFLRRLARGDVQSERVVLDGTPEQIRDALARIEGSGVRVRR